MVRTERSWLGKVAVIALGAVLLLGTSAQAIYLDQEQNITLRARVYTQATIRTDTSSSFTFPDPLTGEERPQDTTPKVFAGQLIQHRNFFNPELDAKLTPYTTWMQDGWLSWLSPDDLRFRVAGWGFYDGVYDYGSSQFNTFQRRINASFDPEVAPSTRPGKQRAGAWFIESPSINPYGTTFSGVFSGYETKTPRTTYGYQRRLNELYLSYSKGPVFLRIGKQGISWGESDTIALLDQTNPFDVTLSAPGFFEDIDESRIPLWTVRGSYNLFNTLGPLSSGFVEAYWVPGELDTNTGYSPILTAGPYAVGGGDPQFSPVFPSTFQFVFADHVPQKRMSNSRWGVRFQTVVNRFLTMQAWIYRTFPQAPVPLKIGRSDGRPISINGTNFFVVALEHRLTTVYGLAGTFFLEALDGIVRINAQLFENEPGYIPDINFGITCTADTPNCASPGNSPILHNGSLPRADILRYEIGFDRFFFFRLLNPTNSFVLSTSVVGSYNLDETGGKDFRMNGQLKPGPRCVLGEGPACTGGTFTLRGGSINDYVQAKTADAQAQVTLQSDWMHGRLQPRLTVIGYIRGTYAIKPSVTYRWNDWLLFDLVYGHIGGEYQGLGFFRDRDQVAARVTYQLN